MAEQPTTSERSAIRIGAVTYLNARPLSFVLPRLVPGARITVDLPSRLADHLAAGRLDVALVPSIEYARDSRYTIVSDACVACDGPVQSVKLFGRVPVERIRTLALDEGSRTSAAMARIVLKEQYGIQPRIQPHAIGTPLEDSTADAVMLIGDRGMQPENGSFEFVWDMGRRWLNLTGLPFVFAMWIAPAGVDLQGIDKVLAAARDAGVRQLSRIARHDAAALGISENECLSYLRDNLVFQLGERQRQGLKTFYELASRHALAPPGVELVFYDDQ